jgi:galactokinase
VKPEWLEEVRDRIPHISYKRCAYVLTENGRVIEAQKAFTKRDADMIAQLFRGSHEGLKSEYEVSCFELDALVDIASELPGCFGARMTGAGFGGNTVNLVLEGYVEEFIGRIKEEYRIRTGKETTVRPLKPDKGLSLEIL